VHGDFFGVEQHFPKFEVYMGIGGKRMVMPMRRILCLIMIVTTLVVLVFIGGCKETSEDKEVGLSATHTASRVEPEASGTIPQEVQKAEIAAPIREDTGKGAVNQPIALELSLVEDNNGFRLKWDPAKYPSLTVMKSIQSTGLNKLVVHLIRRMAYANEERRYLLDVVTVDPLRKSYRISSIADVPVADDYTTSSISQVFGFSDPQHLIMIRPVVSSGSSALRYDIVSLHIETGELATLIEGAIPEISPDFLALGWLNKAGNKLYLNSFGGGQLWIADLRAGSVRTLPTLFKHTWPIIRIGPSPDGESYWYEGSTGDVTIYDSVANPISTLSRGEGYHAIGAIQWSPDSRHGIYEYTFDQSGDNVLQSEDGMLIAPQGIKLLDHQGLGVWVREVVRNKGLHMEWAGWFSNSDDGLIHYYDLERADGKTPRKINSDYAIVQTPCCVYFSSAPPLFHLLKWFRISAKKVVMSVN